MTERENQKERAIRICEFGIWPEIDSNPSSRLLCVCTSMERVDNNRMKNLSGTILSTLTCLLILLLKTQCGRDYFTSYMRDEETNAYQICSKLAQVLRAEHFLSWDLKPSTDIMLSTIIFYYLESSGINNTSMFSPVKDMLHYGSKGHMPLEVKRYQIMEHTLCKTMG